MMARNQVVPLLVAAFLVVATFRAAQGAATTRNKLIARFTPPYLDPNRTHGFYKLPVSTQQARADQWAAVGGRRADGTTVWARNGDYRICLLFDDHGGVAGVQVSVSVKDLQSGGSPWDYSKSDEWYRHTFLHVDVYSTVIYFVSKAVLAAGGRIITDATPTAPTIRLLRVKPGSSGVVLGERSVPGDEKGLRAVGWGRQGCYPGQGFHWYENLNNQTKCTHLKTYFPITSVLDGALNGFGVSMWGNLSDSTTRPWLEPQSVAPNKMIMPNAPNCLFDWIVKYGLFSIHFFFVDHVWTEPCTVTKTNH